MRFLNADVIVSAFLLLALMIIILIVNTGLRIKREHNLFLYIINLASIFGGGFLFCLFIQNGILDLKTEQYYLIIGRVMFSLFFATVLVGLIMLVFLRNSSMTGLRLSPNLESVFTIMEDAVFIIGVDGKIINSNIVAIKFANRQVVHLNDFLNIISEKCSDKDYCLVKKLFEDISVSSKSNIQISERFYQLVVFPIYSDSNCCIGANIELRDIHERIVLAEKFDSQNEQLLSANKLLFEQIKILNSLEEEKERLRLLNEIQDSLVNQIEQIKNDISQFNNSLNNKTLNDYYDCISNVTKKLRIVFSDVRSSVDRLSDSAKKENVVL